MDDDLGVSDGLKIHFRVLISLKWSGGD